MTTADLTTSRHPTVAVRYEDLDEDIDVEIAALVLAIWHVDIETVMSCQEVDPGIAWVEFGSSEDFLRFLNIVTEYEDSDGSLYRRICSSEYRCESGGDWEYQYHPMDILEQNTDLELHNVVGFHATVGAYFPVTDIPVLTERLQTFNESMRDA